MLKVDKGTIYTEGSEDTILEEFGVVLYHMSRVIADRIGKEEACGFLVEKVIDICSIQDLECEELEDEDE